MNRLWLYVLGCSAACVARAAPDLNGFWQVIDPPQALRTLSGAVPPLLPPAAAVYQQHQQARTAGDTSFDTTTRCLPPGVPRILYQPEPFEIMQRPGYVFMIFEYQHLTRDIFISDQHGSLILGRRFLGDSIGRWDGDTLVIDTIGLKDGTLLDAAGLPHSRALHVLERYRLEGGQLEDRIHIEDDKTYAEPWDTVVRFRRLTQVEFKEDVCVDRQPNWLRDMQKANE
jgi:hypothetical protein